MSTIADKLIAAAQNEQRIYKKGYDKGVADASGTVVTKPEVEGNYNITANGSYSYTPPADSVFSKVNVEVAVSGGTEDLNDVLTEQEEKLAELSAILAKKADDGSYDEGYADGFEDGKAEGGDNPLYYATWLYNLYRGATFPDGADLVLRLQKPPTGDPAGNSMYGTVWETKGLKSVKFITKDTETSWELNNTFRENTALEVVDLTECSRKITKMDYCFYQSTALKSIYGALDVSECTAFTYSFFASQLRDVEFVPNTIKAAIRFNSGYLTQASIESIINGLADLTSGTAQTLTLNGWGSKLTDDQKARITAKNWTLAY